MYEIEDLEGEPIIGKFYEEELSAINKRMMCIKWKKYLKRKKSKAKIWYW